MKSKLNKISDKELIALLNNKSTEEEAFAEIYSRYSKMIWVYCKKVLQNEEDASDVFQDVFTKFYSYIQENKVAENIKHFLIIIARNTCLNHKRDSVHSLNFADFESVLADDNLNTTIFANEQNEIISKAIDILPFELKEAFILNMYQGMKYQEIADITGVTLAITKNRIFKARDKIKTYLAPFFKDK